MAAGHATNAQGEWLFPMGCHAAQHRKVCVGFAIQVGRASVGLRLAAAQGAVDLQALDADGPLLTLDEMIERHNCQDT